ncbi:MAG: glycosyltransferase family 2 protein [Patescibacteria group bacterium]
MTHTQTAFPISIVIPCRNEEESILPVLKEIQQTLNSAKIVHEIIVVNNNSTDNTTQEAKKAGANVRVIDCEIQGYGASILKGIQKSKYQLICMLDGDGSYHPKDIPILLKRYITHHKPYGYEPICLGNRFASKKTKNIKFLHRVFGVPMLNFVTNTLYSAPESFDSHCGLRLFRKDIVKVLDLKHTDFSFANEMICKALKQKVALVQIPIVLRKDLRVRTSSKIKTIQDGFYALKTIISLRF